MECDLIVDQRYCLDEGAVISIVLFSRLLDDPVNVCNPLNQWGPAVMCREYTAYMWEGQLAFPTVRSSPPPITTQ